MKEQELCHMLALELGWDADLVSQVVGQIKQHALEDSLQGVDEIVQVLDPIFCSCGERKLESWCSALVLRCTWQHESLFHVDYSLRRSSNGMRFFFALGFLPTSRRGAYFYRLRLSINMMRLPNFQQCCWPCRTT